MKKRIAGIVITVLILLVVPATLVFAGLCTPARFSKTFYGELPVLFERLKNTKGKKIVLIGNSAVAFDVRSDLLEQELPGYSVVSFGLYGAVGTKAMLELSRVNIGSGDIIVIMPELYEQTASLYFSATDFYRAADGNTEMLRYVLKENGTAMFAGFPAYASEKYNYDTEKAEETGVYSRSAFLDENGNDAVYMTFERPYNVMAGGYDPVNLPVLDMSVYGEGFLDYLNEYAKYAKKQGATVYYGFTPLNALALDEDAEEKADVLLDSLSNKLEFEVLGHPAKYFLDYRWFYDNNVHLNSAGAYVYTALLAEDLKLVLGLNTPVSIEIPEIPEIPVESVAKGDNADADKFTYEILENATGKYVRLTGLTEEGKKAVELTLPSDYDGIPVRTFAVGVFAGNETISKVVLPSTISTIYDGSFEGAKRLNALVFEHDSVLAINMGQDFLKGADNCYIYVKTGVSTVDCAGGWARYSERIRYYD